MPRSTDRCVIVAVSHTLADGRLQRNCHGWSAVRGSNAMDAVSIAMKGFWSGTEGATWTLTNRWFQAVAYGDYYGAEAEAREAKRGIWVGSFDRAQEWREIPCQAGEVEPIGGWLRRTLRLIRSLAGFD